MNALCGGAHPRAFRRAGTGVQIRFLALFLPVFLLVAGLQADPPKGAITKSVFSLDPEIDCPSCEDAIRHILETAHGVQSADVDVLNNRITVRYDAARINAKALIGRIAVTGYTATEVK
jgi:copper chaperone CopZ